MYVQKTMTTVDEFYLNFVFINATEILYLDYFTPKPFGQGWTTIQSWTFLHRRFMTEPKPLDLG